MKKYICEVYLRFQAENLQEILNLCLGKLCFKPANMSVTFFDDTPEVNDDLFDKVLLDEVLKMPLNCLIIKDRIYEENRVVLPQWFRLRVVKNRMCDEDQCILQWSVYDLEEFFDSSQFKFILSSQNFICCYNYDQEYVFEISNPASTVAGVPTKQQRNPVVHPWEKHFIVCDMGFMAAPVMYFGSLFFKIVSEESLIASGGKVIVTEPELPVIYIKLFDLYDDPSKMENREKQRLFWEGTNMDAVIHAYSAARPFDIFKWSERRKED